MVIELSEIGAGVVVGGGGGRGGRASGGSDREEERLEGVEREDLESEQVLNSRHLMSGTSPQSAEEERMASEYGNGRGPADKSTQPLLGKDQEGKSISLSKESNSIAIACTMLVALGPVTFGYSLGYSSPIQDEIIASLKLSLSQFSMFGSVVNVGAMIGAIASGKVADYAGRKGAMVTASIPHIIGWILTAFCQSVYLLYFARLLVGFGVGMISFAVPVYIAEIAPRHLRGGLGTVNQLAVTIGLMLAYLGGLFAGWRVLAGLGVLPCVLLLIGLTFIPESPRWLARNSKYDEQFTKSLRLLRGKQCDISGEVHEIKNAVEESKLQPEARLSDLGHKKLFRPLVIGVGLQLLQQFSGVNAVMFYAGSIFASAGMKNPNMASLGMGLLQVIMTAAAAGLMDKAGRRLLLMLSAGGMAVTSFLVGFSFYLKDHLQHPSDLDPFVSYLALCSVLVYIVSFSFGMGAIPWIIMSEVFPAHVRGLAGSLATLANWFGAWAVTMFFQLLLVWSSAGSFWVFAVECVVTVIFVAVLVPETRGRTLEEIEAFFK